MGKINLKKSSFYILALAWLCTSCDLFNNKPEPLQAFTKVYETNEYEANFSPISVAEIPDNGYLILGELYSENTNFLPAFLLKIDKTGKVEWQKTSTTLFNPCSKIITDGTNRFFIAMLDGSFTAAIASADSNFQLQQTVNAVTFPLAAEKIGNDLVIMGYNTFNRQTTLTRANLSGAASWTQNYDVFEDVQENISNHLLRQSPRPFPFYVREAGANHYAFNGLNNFTLAHTYVTKASGAQTGILNGVRYLYGMADFVLKSNGTAAAARHKGNGNVVITPNFNPVPTGVAASLNVAGIELPELAPFSKVVIKTGVLQGKNVVVYAANTKSGQVMLIAYDELSANVLGTKYLGANTLYEIGDFTFTSDGSVLVVGTVQSAGRFGRIFITKLTEGEAKKLVGITN